MNAGSQRFMRMLSFVTISFLLAMVCSSPVPAQPGSGSKDGSGKALRAANAEMGRLAAKLTGDWNITETMERSSFFPQGGSRTGRVHVTLASGGYTLHTLVAAMQSEGGRKDDNSDHNTRYTPVRGMRKSVGSQAIQASASGIPRRISSQRVIVGETSPLHSEPPSRD
jgi:hypothetical protein